MEGGAIPPGGGRLPPTPSQLCSPQPTHVPGRLGHWVLLPLRASQSSLEPQPSLAPTHTCPDASLRAILSQHPTPSWPLVAPAPASHPHPAHPTLLREAWPIRGSGPGHLGIALRALPCRLNIHLGGVRAQTPQAALTLSPPAARGQAAGRRLASAPLPAQLLLPGQEDGVPGCPWGGGSWGDQLSPPTPQPLPHSCPGGGSR